MNCPGIRTGTRSGRSGRDVQESGFGYFLEMATRPQTIGYALLDSPVALAAGCSTTTRTATTRSPAHSSTGSPVGNLTRENIVDNVTLYWLTGTAASAARSYWEDARALAASLASGQPPPAVTVPVGFTTFPGESGRPRSWVEAVYPAYLTRVDRAASIWEEPELFSAGLRAAFSSLPSSSPLGARRHPRTAASPIEGHLPGFDGATSSSIRLLSLRRNCAGGSSSSISGRTPASTGSARWPSCAHGPRNTATSGSSSSASIRPSFRSRARSRTSARPRRRWGRLHDRGRRRLRRVDRLRQPVLAGHLPRRRAGADPLPPLRRGRVRRRRVDDPAPAARGRGRGSR